MKLPTFNLRLQSKIYGFVLLLVVFFIALNVLFFMQINHIFNDYKASDQANLNIQQSIQITGEIEKLQRHVQNYTYTGYLDSADAARKLYHTLFKRLVQSTTQSSETSQTNYDSMRLHLERYYAKFNELILQRGTQQQLRDNIRQYGEQIEKGFQNYLASSNGPEQIKLAQQLYIRSYQVEKGAFRYFESLDNRFAKLAKQSFKTMWREFKQLKSLPQTPPQQSMLKTLEEQIALTEKTFTRSIQHTRGYLSLVNVVMAAEAFEVLYHANQINQNAQKSVKQIKQALEMQYEQVIQTSIIGSLILMGLALILAILNVKSVVRPIASLNQAFQSLARGDTDAKIPDYNIHDEIGQLTLSAKEFQNKNIETQHLLSESEQLSQKLLSVQERLTIATTSAQIGVWDWNLKTNELFWDEMMFKIYHLHPEDFSSHYEAWSQALHPDDRIATEELLTESTQHNKNFDTVFRIVWPNGEERYIKAYAITLYDDTGDAIHTIGVNYDITEFEQLRHHLEKRVKAELATQQEQEQVLIQQSKLAAMGEMISAISRQWRQPLNEVSLYLQDLLSAQSHDQLTKQLLEDNVTKSRKKIKFISKTIDDFHTFFNPDSEDTDLDLNGLIKHTLNLFEAQFEDNDITINLTTDQAKSYPLHGNANHMQQSLANLITNAIDAIKERRQQEGSEFKALISITLKNHKEFYSVELIDNGIGLSKESEKKAFEPYFTTKDEGIGIGLYMTRTIIKKYFNGRVDLYPIPNQKGARTLLRVPHD